MKNITTIIKKELRAYFNNPTAYIIVLAFLLLWEFLFFQNVFLIGESSLRGLFELLPWLAIIIIPVLTMGTLSEEKNEGTLEFLLTHPINQLELIIGKFLGIFLFFMLTMLFIFPLAWSLNHFGSLDWGRVVCQYLAGAMFSSVLISLGILVSSFFSSQISAFLISAVANFFLIIFGMELVSSRLPLFFAPFLEQFSLLNHFESMSRGVIDARDVWYFVSLSAVFLVFAYLNLIKNKYGNRKKAYHNYQIALIFLIGIVFLSNMIGLKIPGRIDLTQGKIYTLSDATKKITSELPDIVNISLYASDKLPAQFQPILRETKDILEDYHISSNGKIRVSYKNPSSDSEIISEASSMGIQPIRFNVVSQEEFQVKDGYLGLAVSYGGKHESIPFIENIDNLEYQLSSFLKKLTDDNKPKIGFISGHGEKTLTDYGYVMKELKKQFDIEEIIAKSDESEDTKSDVKTKKDDKATDETSLPKKISIPEEVKALIVAGPTQDYSDNEKDTLSKFITDGGSVLFMIDEVAIDPQTMNVSVSSNNLGEYLKNEIGVEVKKNLAYDLNSNEVVRLGGNSINYITPYPFWIKASKAENSSVLTSKIENILLPWASSLEVDEKVLAEKGFEKMDLFSTTKAGGAQSSSFNISPDNKFSRQELSKKTLAVSLLSKKEGDNQSRIIIIGNSIFLADQFVQNNQNNFSFALESLSWLSQESGLSQIRVKTSADRKLVFKDKSETTLVKFGNLAFVFFLTVGYGAWRLMRRKKMKDEIYQY